MLYLLRRSAHLVVAAGLIACGSDSTGPEKTGQGGTLSATISGVAFSPPTRTVGANYANQILSIQGSTSSSPVTALTINVLNVTGPGVYQLNPNFAGTFGQVTITNGANAQLWSTALSPGNGSITVTALTSTRVAGSFNFTAQSVSGGAAGQKSVTSGSFDISF